MNKGLPSLRALRALEAVVRCGGVGPAAAELHVTHGAISHQLRALDAELGLALFRREGRRLTPTPAGQRLAEVAGTAFGQLADVVARLRREATQAPLVLGCSASVLARWIIPQLAELERALPMLRLHLSPQESMPDPALTGLDAALLLAAPPWPDAWVVRELAIERIGPVVAPASPLARELAERGPEALLEQSLLHTRSRPQAWAQWARACDLDPASLRQGTGFEHLYYLLEAASAGLGVAIAPEPLVREDLGAGRLLAPWGFVPTTGRWLLCNRSEDEARRLQPLASWLAQRLAAESGSA